MAYKKGCSKWALVSSASVALVFTIGMILCFLLQQGILPGRSFPVMPSGRLPPSLTPCPQKVLSPLTALMASSPLPTKTLLHPQLYLPLPSPTPPRLDSQQTVPLTFPSFFTRLQLPEDQ